MTRQYYTFSLNQHLINTRICFSHDMEYLLVRSRDQVQDSAFYGLCPAALEHVRTWRAVGALNSLIDLWILHDRT